MKVLLILPISDSNMMGKSFAFNLPFLGLITLAACTPSTVDLTLVDERVDNVNFDEKYDLVGITVMTPLAPRAYKIAEEFRKRGVKVVMGGMHVSAMPDEVLEHADSVVIGEGEKVWPKLLEDCKNGLLEKRYKASEFTDLDNLISPRRDLMDKSKFAPVEFVETTRGCPFGCHFCSVTQFFGGKYRLRPVDNVVEEIRTFKPTTKRFSIKNVVFFVDDNIIGHRSHAIELFKKIKPFGLRWLGQASMNVAKDEELLTLAAESGCLGFLIGFESLSSSVLENVAKKANKVSEYLQSIRKIQSYGIGIMGSFIFGFDEDEIDIFDKYLKFMRESKLEGLYLGILTPYPGTKFFEQYKKEGRILHYDWTKYDTSNVVFKPKNMTPEELKKGYLRVYKETYSLLSIFHRLKDTKAMKQFVWPMNVGFNISVRKFARKHK